MLKYSLFFFCLILSQFGWSQTNRQALLEEAFNGLPYLLYATTGKLDEDYFLNEKVHNFTAQENQMLKSLLQVVMSRSSAYSIVFCGPKPCFDIHGKQISFELEKGQEPRTAVTSSEMDEHIYINLAKINDSKTQMDFVDAIQLLIHEVSKKIPNLEQAAFDTLAAKLTASIRNGYSTFKVNDKRMLHVLTLDRPNRFDRTELQQMEVFWIKSQGFEVTTFDEADGYFRHIEEVRHNFASPDLMKPRDIGPLDTHHTLSKNSIMGVEVDRFNDATTVVRIAVDQMQTLLKPNYLPADLGPISIIREVVIKLKDHEAPIVTRRQGYIPSTNGTGNLTSFEVVDSVLTGTGVLPIRLGDMKDYKLSLLVRNHDSLLNLPLIITSRDPNGPVVFKFERKLAEEREAAQLIATDIVVSAGAMVPLNKIPLQTASTINLRSTMRKRISFQIQDVEVQGKHGFHSVRSSENKIEKGENNFRFIFASSTPLQELTIYLDHSRQIFDPEKLQNRSALKYGGATSAGPTPFDVQISSEVETDVFRIAAAHMKQTVKDGVLTVELKLPVREATTLQITDNHSAYYGKKEDLAKTIATNLDYGVDNDGYKLLAKIEAVNEGLQKITVSNPEFRVRLSGKKGNQMTPEVFNEFNKAFISIPDTNPASPLCRDKFK